MISITDIKNLRQNSKAKQILSLFLVNLIGIPIGIITSIIITRFLGAKGYGDYMFLNSIFLFSVILCTFGFFQASNRALVLSNDTIKSKEYYGGSLLILFTLFFIMSIGLFLFATFDNNIAQKGLKNILLFLIPFGWVFLLLRYFETLFQADNKIKLLAATRLFPKLIFFISAIIIYFLFKDNPDDKLYIIWAFYLISFISVYIIVLFKIKLKFTNLKIRISEIWNYNKEFGIHVYSGSLFALGFSQLTSILISYFSIENSGVGYFSLALTFAAPLSLIPNVIATTHYKDFASLKKIPKNLILITLALSIFSLILLWLIVGPFIKHFYGTEFLPVIKLNFIVSIGVVLHGFADFFNRFLGAHGKGKSLRNSSFIIGLLLLTLNLILIPKLGELGAAITKIATGFLYFTLMYFYYKKLLKTL